MRRWWRTILASAFVEDVAHDQGRPAVGGGDGVGVDGQRRRGGGVPEALAYRPDRYTAVEEPGGDVVGEVVKADSLQADSP